MPTNTARFVFTLCVALTGCTFGGSGNRDADRFAESYWKDRISECGDTYVVSVGLRTSYIAGVFEYKGLKTWTNAVDISEADKLNGFEFRGATGFTMTSMRMGSKGKPPSDWMNVNKGMSMYFWKKNGVWQADDKQLDLQLHPGCNPFR